MRLADPETNEVIIESVEWLSAPEESVREVLPTDDVATAEGLLDGVIVELLPPMDTINVRQSIPCFNAGLTGRDRSAGKAAAR